MARSRRKRRLPWWARCGRPWARGWIPVRGSMLPTPLARSFPTNIGRLTGFFFQDRFRIEPAEEIVNVEEMSNVALAELAASDPKAKRELVQRLGSDLADFAIGVAAHQDFISRRAKETRDRVDKILTERGRDRLAQMFEDRFGSG